MKASLVLLLLLSCVGLSLQLFVRDWSPITDAQISSEPYYRNLANATVAWYNKQQNSNIVLLNVTGGYAKQVVDTVYIELHYVLNMDVLLEPQPKCHNIAPSHYQGVMVQEILKMRPPVLTFYYFGEPIYKF